MALSETTISKLADALKSEVIDYIYEDERWSDFLQEIIPDAIHNKLGEVDDAILFDLAMCVIDRIELR